MNLQDLEYDPTAHRCKNSYSAVSVLKPALSATNSKLTSKTSQFTFSSPLLKEVGGEIQCQTNAISSIILVPTSMCSLNCLKDLV